MSSSRKCKSGVRRKGSISRSDGEIYGEDSHQGPLVDLSVPLPVSVKTELDRLAAKEKKRPAALAQEILHTWVISRRDKERASAENFRLANQEDREAMLYGSSLHDADLY